MNEPISDGVNGLLVRSHEDGTTKSGIAAVTPDVDELAAAISRLADPELRRRLAAGAREVRDTTRAWSHTVEGMAGLIEQLDREPAAR
jgi:glycosyltransferase involved in cell wall biosynthesis